MNTKTMRLPPRRDPTPAKRKERNDFIAPKPPPTKKPLKPTTTPHLQHQAGLAQAKAETKPNSSNEKFLKPTPPPPPPPPRFQAGLNKKAKAEAKPESSNQLLLAGYLAHEFLTEGTLFGQTFDPARSEAVLPPVKKVAEPRKRVGAAEKEQEEEEEEEGRDRRRRRRRRYVEVASLLKADGDNIKGIVNPTQLARFLNL